MSRAAPPLSVVIPLYNKAATIRRAITSVVDQSVVDWELIVVDDGSTDDGAAIVESYTDSRIILETQANGGVSAARNRGIALSRAPIVAFLDADDYWAPDHLSNLERLIEEYPAAVLYATAYNLVFDTGHRRRVRLRPDMPCRAMMPDYFAESVTAEIPIQTSGVAARKTALERIGGFPIGVKAGEDLITWSRLVCLGQVAYSTEATTFYGAQPLTPERRLGVVRRPDRPDYVGAALRELVEQYPTRARSLERFLAYWHRMCAMAYAELGEPLPSLEQTWKAIVLDRPTLRDGVVSILSAMPRPARGHLFALARLHRRRRQDDEQSVR